MGPRRRIASNASSITDGLGSLSPSDSASNPDLAAPSLAELPTAETIRQWQTQRSFVATSTSGISYGPRPKPFAAERNDGHYNLQQQTSQRYSNMRAPVLLQSTDSLAPFTRNTIQALPLGVLPFESNLQQTNFSPRAGLQTQPIIQYWQSRYGRAHFEQAHHVEHPHSTMFPLVLGPFKAQLATISKDAATAAQSGKKSSAGTTQQHAINKGHLTPAKGSRKDHKRKACDEANETNTNTKRQRLTGPNGPSSVNNPPAPMSDAEVERRADRIFHMDPWLWSVSDVHFSLTNVHSHDLRRIHNLSHLTLPQDRLGLILRKFKIDGQKLLVNLTQAELRGLGITQADSLAATGFLLDEIRSRSPLYQLQQNSGQTPTPISSTITLAPQTNEASTAIIHRIQQRHDSLESQFSDQQRRESGLTFDA